VKIRYVRQKHEFGCAVASAAMILGAAYDEVGQAFQNDFDKGGIENEPIRDYICEHGFSVIEKTAHSFMHIEPSNKRMIIPFAEIHLVRVQPYADSKTNHCLVMDRRGVIYDPARPDNKQWDYYFVFHVMGFFYEGQRKANRTARGRVRRSRGA
jgi:hypothetical protein